MCSPEIRHFFLGFYQIETLVRGDKGDTADITAVLQDHRTLLVHTLPLLPQEKSSSQTSA